VSEASGAKARDEGGDHGPLLSVRDLTVRIGTKRGVAEVLTGLSYDLRAGETLAIVGESGSGKSISVLSLLGLVPQPPARVTGQVRFEGQDLLAASDQDLRRVRGRRIGMVFQDPMTSLNPVLTIGRQVTESMQLHLGLDDAAARRRAVELLDRVGIPAAARRLDDYPHQLSGGMRQRVMIAIGLACDPAILVADEATTALDVTIQAQILELVAELQRELGMAVIWITHDLGVVAGIADRILVLYGGRSWRPPASTTCTTGPATPTRRGCSAPCRCWARTGPRSSSPSRGCRRTRRRSRPAAPSRRAAPTASTSAA
jgi:ABC-type microcin C transport system duplicated ATPase subunit YejF